MASGAWPAWRPAWARRAFSGRRRPSSWRRPSWPRPSRRRSSRRRSSAAGLAGRLDRRRTLRADRGAAWLRAALAGLAAGGLGGALAALDGFDGARGALHQDEPQLVTDRVIGPDLGHLDADVGAQPPGHVDRRRRHVEVELGALLGKGRPLRHRLEVVHRLGGLHLDDARQAAPTLGGVQDQVGIPRRRRRPTGAVCSCPGLMATSNFLLYFACSRRITRSCSSCSRTGRTRMGLNKTSGRGKRPSDGGQARPQARKI